MGILQDKKVIIGVCGGIAAYKTCEVIRMLDDLGAETQVVMTENAARFVGPLTFETLTRQPVLRKMFEEEKVGTRHIDLPRKTDKLLICPATANIIGKIANGIADDLLSTISLVAGAEKTIICPAMNSDMWAHPSVVRNVKTLVDSGYTFVDPEYGLLACLTDGVGKLADVEQIVTRVKIELLRTNELAGRNLLITAGPTEEPLDPVRFLTNSSSGKMGFALAEAALSRGAAVTLIAGPTQLEPPPGAEFIGVRTSSEMLRAAEKAFQSADALIMAAAVSDYRPVEPSKAKIKKDDDSLPLTFEKTEDILASLSGKKKKKQILVGFAIETENLVQNAVKKLREKDLDLIVANNPGVEGAGFDTDTNVVTIIDREEQETDIPKASKFEIAMHILDEMAVCFGIRPPRFKTSIQV